MSERFNAYEFIAVVVPGSVITAGLALLYFYDGQKLAKNELGLGDLGIFLTLSFVAGHLLQAIGNWIETIFWNLNRGLPTNKVIQPDQSLLADGQIQRLNDAIKQDFGQELQTVSETDWRNITREIGVRCKAENRTERMEAFNRSYGLMRGIAAAFCTMMVLILLENLYLWKAVLLCFFCFCIAVYRMHRFGIHYARELFLSYLSLKVKP